MDYRNPVTDYGGCFFIFSISIQKSIVDELELWSHLATVSENVMTIKYKNKHQTQWQSRTQKPTNPLKKHPYVRSCSRSTSLGLNGFSLFSPWCNVMSAVFGKQGSGPLGHLSNVTLLIKCPVIHFPLKQNMVIALIVLCYQLDQKLNIPHCLQCHWHVK